jgi:hypothetical protein
MTRIKPKDGNKTFCMAPWTHTYLSPQMERRLCCASREESTNFEQYIDSSGPENKELKLLSLKRTLEF